MLPCASLWGVIQTSYWERSVLSPNFQGAWETLARRQHAISQLDTLAREAGLDLVELIGSGMKGKELLEFVMDKHKWAKAVTK